MSSTTLPYEWLKEVPTSLLQKNDIPLLGFPPIFPWEQFNELLKKTFQTQNIEVKPLTLQWRSSEDLFSALGEDLIPINFQIPSLNGDLSAVIAKHDIHLLMSLLISQQKEPLDVIDPDFQNGFIHFLSYEMINIFNQCNFDKTINPHVAEKTTDSEETINELLSKERSLCQDISFSLEGSTFIFRLIISDEFRQSFKEKYAIRTLDIPLREELGAKIHIPIALEVGRVLLPLSTWKQITVGDFLILDICSLDPKSDKGRVTLTVNGNRFFRAKLKNGTLKILEHPLFHEDRISGDKQHEQVTNTMAKDIAENDDSELDDSQFGLSEFDASIDEDDEHSQADPSITSTEQLKDETVHEDDDEEISPPKSPVVADKAPKFKTEDIGLDIVIEVGRLQMSIAKLNELQPGNVLEIDVHPENGVDLVVNGKRIAKGELLKLGEVLGVRILDI